MVRNILKILILLAFSLPILALPEESEIKKTDIKPNEMRQHIELDENQDDDQMQRGHRECEEMCCSGMAYCALLAAVFWIMFDLGQ